MTTELVPGISQGFNNNRFGQQWLTMCWMSTGRKNGLTLCEERPHACRNTFLRQRRACILLLSIHTQNIEESARTLLLLGALDVDGLEGEKNLLCDPGFETCTSISYD